MHPTTATSRTPLALLLALILAVSGIVAMPAQAAVATPPDTKGQDFWIAFPKGRALEEFTLSVSMTSPSATSGTVSVPGLSWSQGFSVSPPAATVVTVPSAARLGEGSSGDPEDLGIHITTSDDVSVSARFSTSATGGDLLALPTDALTQDYLALAWKAPGRDAETMFSEFAVLATEDDTEVTITSAAATTSGRAPGDSWTTTLSKGQALPVVSKTGDLSGSVISATKPVAVFGAHSCATIPNNQTLFCDYVLEQLPGSDTWGTSFLTVPLKPRTGDTFRMLASKDSTAVSVDGVPVANLDRGEFHEQILSAASVITATHPILVAQYANGFQYDGTIGDPAMLVVPATEQFLDSYTFSVPGGFQTNTINVIAPSAAVGAVKLDDVAIPAGSFSPIGGSGYSGAQVDTTAGGHSVTSPQPVGVAVYGFTGRSDFAGNEGFGFPAGYGLPARAFVTRLSLTPTQQNVTVNQRACATGTASRRDGDTLPGVPLALTVTGANPQQASGTTGPTGEYTFCYTGANAGTDSLTVTIGSASAATTRAKADLSASATVQWEAAPSPPPMQPPTPTPTPTPPVEEPLPSGVKGVKASTLPIRVKGVMASPVQLGAKGKAVLARAITTNEFGQIATGNSCRPVAPGAAGEVRYCDISVSKKGKVTVRSTGFDAVKVTVRVRATPRAGTSDQWRPSRQRITWVVRL